MRRRRRHLDPRRRVLAIALPFLALVVAFLWAGLRAPDGVPGVSYDTATVELRDGGNLTAHTQVRVAGELVGQVLNPRVVDGRALVDVQLDPKVGPLRRDARVHVRPRSAVGSPYVELFPGSARAAWPGDRPLPASRSTAAIPLDDVLSTFDPRTRARTRELLDQLGEGTAARGEDVNRTVARAPHLLRDLRTAVQPLLRDRGALPAFVRGAAATAAGFSGVRDLIPEGFRRGAITLEALNRRAPLTRALDVGPGALLDLRQGLRRADPLLDGLDRLARVALPVLRGLPGTLHDTDRFLASADAHIGGLRTTLRRAAAAVAPTLQLLRTTTRVAPELETAFTALRPAVDELAPRRCDMLAVTRNWTSMMSNGTKDGNVLRLAIVTAGFNSITGFRNTGDVEPGVYRNPYPAPCAATTTDKAPRR